MHFIIILVNPYSYIYIVLHEVDKYSMNKNILAVTLPFILQQIQQISFLNILTRSIVNGIFYGQYFCALIADSIYLLKDRELNLGKDNIAKITKANHCIYFGRYD